MDYSLLLGIHNMDQAEREKVCISSCKFSSVSSVSIIDVA